MLGVFLVYTYLSIIFDRATQGDGRWVAALMSIWGIASKVALFVIQYASMTMIGRRRAAAAMAAAAPTV